MSEPWYRESFSSTYLELYAHRDQKEGSADSAHAVKLAGITPEAKILDLCCGAGRHLIALAELGYTNLTGLDLSADLLTQARRDVDQRGIQVRLIEADMRAIPEDACYDVIFSLFTSFGYFEEDAENLTVLMGAHARLNPTGVLVMDTINPAYLRTTLVPHETKHLAGRTLDITRCITTDRPRVEKTTVVSDDDGNTATYNESVRLFEPQEMQDLFHQAGFTTVELFGSLSGDQLTSECPRLVVRATDPSCTAKV